ncbi:MAG: sugar ABC transporter substrate-binding protein [Candidatus Limnocylindria bacterium]|nr:MAG: ABC transporter substrate-binding protein [Chloroflexota bacterium]
MTDWRRTAPLALCMVLVLAACGRSESTPGAGGASQTGGSQPAAGGGPVTGTLDVWAMGTEGEKLSVLAKDFMAANPGVTVKVTAIPWDAAHDKIRNALTTTGPDVTLVGTTWMGEFAKLGGLDKTPSDIDKGQFYEGAWNSTVVGGASYGVPWYVETRVLYYNTDLAKKGGMSDAPKNWNDLKALAQDLKKAGAKSAIELQPGGTGSWQTFMPFFWQKGGEIMDGSGKFTLNSQACTDALTYYQSFFKEGLATKAAADTPMEARFAKGQVGAFISGPWMIQVVTDAGAKAGTFTVAPQPKEQSGTSFVGGGDLAVLANSNNKPAAWAFVKYLSKPEVQVKWYATVKDLPAVKSAWSDQTLSGDKLLKVFGDQLNDAKAPPAIPKWEEIAAQIDTAIEQVTVGSMSPADGCKSMQDQATSIGSGS